ncbi:MAG TPA: type IX secretion system sortase PorU [Bacteroidales bacterium]|jgi:hypothetical protein|nr:MAG: hypothetical protein BWX96_01972 [Bacteroidetes bacterium ADurb.Bin145]HOU02390.1 type IX secretion system sortase PorU [Bacteroidales bacterium]HQK68728.1 type IX secretion system sortase PorU [Bacteroidales bacterium]
MTRLSNILLLIFFLIINDLYSQGVKDSYSSSSVLAGGQWFKIAVLKDGIYRIDYSDLKQMGLFNPSNPRIYSNNFGQLSYYNDDPKPDDLKEVAVHLVTGSDGIFNEGDYLLFFGQSTNRWNFNPLKSSYDYLKHNYSDTAFYFLTSGSQVGKKILNGDEPAGPPNYFSSQSDALFVHELDNENLLKSGREWYQPVSAMTGLSINPGFTDLRTDEKLKYRIRVLARASVNTLFRLYENSTLQRTLQVQGVNLYNYTGTYAQIADSSASFYPLSSSPSFEIRFYNNGEPAARGWLDYVILQGRRNNTFAGNTAFFSDYRSIGAGRITEFTFSSPANTPLVWDITDPFNPSRINYSKTGDNLKFKAFTGSLKSYVLFLEKNTLKPVIMTPALANQDLHSSEPAEMIIVTHPLFRNYADRIAQVHYGNSGLTSQVVTPDEIYNEFSGGIRDLVAIRNFLRMKYLKQAGTDHPLKYLLLLGDGSYENRTLPPLNPNFIPTYQSQNSNIVVSSFTSDDFFGLLEDGEGEAEGTEDIGIGRLPVSDTAQAGIMLRKISRYLGSSNTGDWKNNICIIADDEDGNTHINDAEGLSKILEDSVPSMNIKKIYLDAFRQVTTVNGQSYPDVTAAINEQVSSGALIINYVGHGSENGLAHERVVKTEDIKSWSNFHRLPLFITATCEFSRFDDMDINIITKEMTGRPSAGEMVLLSATGGGIALMSTTRVVYSAPNYYLNRNIFDFAFDRDTLGEALRLGDIMRLAKNNSGSGTNKRNFSLLGDPALRLAYPWHGNVVTDSVNHVLVSEGTDTLKALSRVTISGHIENMRGETLNDFTGTVSPIVFDKTKTIKTLANDGGQPYSFKLRNNILFSGKTTAAGGKFRFSFIVPRDIDYSYGPGKISYYASNNGQDLNGYFNDIIVGGFAQVSESDKSGPKISLYMNDTLFRNGGITDKDPKILAIIEDKGGINTTGTGIGHDLVAYLDNDNNNSFVLNNYFENDIDNYMKGKVVYGLSDLTGGQHSVTLKAWDNFNNSSVETIHFVVETDGRFILKDLLNYPNPVQNETKITAGHNRPEKLMDITITIYDLSGRAVRIIRTTEITSGYQLSPIIWDGKSEEGSRVGKGIYIYRISVVTPDGEKASASGRIIIL